MKDCVSSSFLRNQPYCTNVNQLLIALKGFDLKRENGIAETNELEPQDGGLIGFFARTNLILFVKSTIKQNASDDDSF